jgi:hypothetical protein
MPMGFNRLAAPLLLAFPLAAGADDSAVLPSLPALLLDRHALVKVDGNLDEGAWAKAPEFAAFHQFLPENGKPVPEGVRTSVKLLIDEHALIFGIRAWDADAANLRGSLVRRDKFARDQDFIGIWLDPTGHSRAAQFVRVNVDGVLSDGMYRADEDEQDMGPDFPVDAAVRRLPDGYTMEIRWPLSNLRFPYDGGNAWRLMIERSVPHAGGLVLTSTPLKTGSISFIDALQPIDGMGATVETVRDRAFLDLKPELTVRANRDRDDDGRHRANKGSLGLEINARPRADWVFNATLNPDFSQVEIDEPMPTGASRIALSLPEKRAFFLESADVLGLPLPAFYSRTIASPEWGLRATWRSAQADATAMSLRDEEGGAVQRGRVYETAEFAQTRRTLASLVRGRWHGDGALFGAFASQRDDGNAGANAVAGFDGQWRAEGRQASWLLMHSRTTAGFTDDGRTVRVPSRSGSYAQGRYVHTSDDWWNEFKLEAIGPGFVNDNGFVPQAGVVKADVNVNRRLGEKTVPFPFGALRLYEFEAHLGLHETRTLSDSVSGQRANEVVERKIQPGIWYRAGRQTDLWANLGFDRQRAHRAGRLHDVPALHVGFQSSPLPWMPVLKAEVTLGRQLDVDADRVGGGGNVVVDAGLRFPLPRGWALESDVRVNRAWIQGTLGSPAFADNGWRWLGMLHFTASDSLRVLAQNTSTSRRYDGVTPLDPWSERGSHRSLLYRHLWRHGRSMSVGFSRDRASERNAATDSLTFKFQWEV